LIVYRLICSSGHEFEGWFRDSNAFDAQAKKGTLECPVCSDGKVTKAIMAPALARSGEVMPPQTPPTVPADQQKLRQFMAGYRKFIEENAEYVGPKFPEEARKIHYGETDERHIYGESSLKEARELIEEGIEIAPVPPDPGDLN
jgi:hypothetical protein